MRILHFVCTWFWPLFTLYVTTSAISLHPGVSLQRIQHSEGGRSTSQTPSTSRSQHEITMAHHRSLRKNLATLNHLYTQQNYLLECRERNIIPKGLLLKKQCALVCEDNTSSEWQATLWNASRQLRDIITSEISRKIVNAEENVQTSKSALYEQTNPRTYHDTLNTMNGPLTQCTRRETKQKQRKIKRDEAICQKIKASLPNSRNDPSDNPPASPPQTTQPRIKHNRRYNKRAYRKRRRNNTTTNGTDTNNNTIEDTNATAEDDESNTPIVNLSNYDLKPAEISLLSKGLTFCPTPPSIDPVQVQRDFQEFQRHMKLKVYFNKDNDSSQDSQNSTATPATTDDTEITPSHQKSGDDFI